ncbi:MAG: BREX-6 system phosphatase PglZ [Stigonema ocellatum SAG 48.90 = DSM 106950]|nr:BREX-6 system phosphatase PglZ [Stigonema ocellatum SAG 48.90 = DSM 106950]
MPIITTYLEEEIKQKLREQGIVIWLDKDAHYNSYVDQLITRHRQGTFFAPVIAFRGSYLEILFALESYGNGLDPEPLLIHMPGHTEDTIRKTPILELYRAGYRFRKALDTLIREAATGQVTPTELENYLSQGFTNLTAAETWLENTLSQPQDSLAKYLENFSLEWILEGLLDLDSIIDEAKKLRSQLRDTHNLDILRQHLYRHTGMDDAFLQFYCYQETLSFSTLGEAFAAWLMCVEYVQDLNRSPHLSQLQPLSQLSPPLLKTCKQLIEYLRQRYPDTYAAKAIIVESHLELELQTVSTEELSKIKTFQWGENEVLAAAVQALLAGKFTKVLAWSQPRTESPGFWLEGDRNHRIEWTLIQAAATLGDKIQNSGGIKTLDNLRESLEYYTRSGYQVDQAHRRFEQQCFNLLESKLPHFTQLLEATEQLRRQYRDWADTLAQDFTAICQKDSFLPEDDLQQRTLYDQVIHPLTQNNHKKVAYFLIDAFRYEMATELLSEFTEAGTIVSLKARYAELPTITAVGMNALAPVTQGGKLILAGDNGFKGFKTGEYTVRSPQERVRAMKDKSISHHGKGNKDIASFNLAEVRNYTTSKLKKSCADVRLIVIHSREIDDAGEANLGLATFESWLQQIKAAWNHLKNIGVNEFVLTADHGFLLQDHTTQEIKYGRKKDPSRRYIINLEPRSEEGCVTVSLSSLKYEGQNKYLIFSQDTSVFATGNPSATFVHGGNSLQERVIPVLTVSQRYHSHLGMVKYLIEAQADNNKIRLKVKPAPLQSVLNFAEAKTINLAFRVPNRQDIQITIKDIIGARMNNQQLQIPATGEWVEVVFDLRGQRDERVRVEIFHPDGVEDVVATIPQEYFDVSGSLKTEVTTTQTSTSNDWQDSFEDKTVAQVFLHLQQHNSITETELTQILGNARQARRFALDFEEYLKKVPFSVRIETTNNGKRYVKHN